MRFEDEGEARLVLAREVASVVKRRRRETVRVRTIVETREETLEAALATGAVEVDRVACDRFVDVAPAVRVEGDTTVFSVVREVAVVVRRLKLVEEIRLRRMAGSETVRIPVELRAERAIVERQVDALVDVDALADEDQTPVEAIR